MGHIVRIQKFLIQWLRTGLTTQGEPYGNPGRQTYDFTVTVSERTAACAQRKPGPWHRWAPEEQAGPRACAQGSAQHQAASPEASATGFSAAFKRKLDEWECLQKMAEITASMAKSGLLK